MTRQLQIRRKSHERGRGNSKSPKTVSVSPTNSRESRLSSVAKFPEENIINRECFHKIELLQQTISHQKITIDKQEKDLLLAADEIELLAQALELRVESLSTNNKEDIKSAILYELALYQQQNHKLERSSLRAREEFEGTTLKLRQDLENNVLQVNIQSLLHIISFITLL